MEVKCKFCGKDRIVATSDTTGCCYWERVRAGYLDCGWTAQHTTKLTIKPDADYGPLPPPSGQLWELKTPRGKGPFTYFTADDMVAYAAQAVASESTKAAVLNDELGAWTLIESKKPPISECVLVMSADGRMWVGSYCDWETCNQMHYQADSHEPNYIPNPTHWMPLPEPPLS